MKRFSIVLLIKHPSIDPKAVSRELNLEHYACGMAGKPKINPKGDPIPGTWEQSWWNHIFDYEGNHDFFDEIERLLAQLASHRDFFVKIKREGGYSELYLELPGEAHQGSSAKPSILKLMAELEINFGVEVFPKMNPRDSKDYTGTKGITFVA